MRSKDVKPTQLAKFLIVGEDSNLQWSENVTEYVMFGNYYFQEFPKDHGERSRHVEAQNLFNYIHYLTQGMASPENSYLTNLCNDYIRATSPKGKRTLIPETNAIKGFDHIKWILEENRSIEYIIALSMQTNYWLQKLGLYTSENDYIERAQPRRIGLSGEEPFYQPIDGKAFTSICFRVFETSSTAVKIIPALPAKDFPFNDQTYERYGATYENLRAYFKPEKI